MTPLTAVVIPVFGEISHTRKCLHSLVHAGASHPLVIIVDHGNNPESAPTLKRDFPDTIVLRADPSLWWSGATNVGIRHAMTLGVDFVLLMNNDTVAEPAFLDRLIETAEANPNHIVCSVVYFIDSPRVIRYAGGRMRWTIGDVSSTFYGETESCLPKEPYEADWAGGMGVLVPMIVFRNVGLFDETWFPHYGGDEDLWLRAKEKGFGLLVDPRSKIWVDDSHTGSKRRNVSGLMDLARLTFDQRFHANIPTTLRLYWRHCPLYSLPIGLTLHFIRNAIRILKP